MRYIIIFILSFLTIKASAQAQDLYFAESGMDGGGCSIFLPCQSVTYLNTQTLIAGDSIFFNKNDTFNIPQGGLTVNASGSSSHPIWFGAYGTGALPVMTGSYKLSGFTNIGGNIYTAPCPSCRAVTNLVTYDGNLQAMGRYPDTGYDTIATVGTGYMTDPSLAGQNFTGAQLVLRTNHFQLTRNKITRQGGDTLYYTATNGTAVPGWGFFVQNSPNVLNLNGDWFYDSTAKQMHVYLTDTTKPVIVGIIDTLAYANVRNFIIFDHLNLQYANTAAMELADNTSLRVQFCKITYDNQGIFTTLETNCQFLNDTIQYVLDYGLSIAGNSTGNNVIGGVMHDVGMVPGMGVNSSGYFCVSLRSANTRLNSTLIYNVGYEPVLIAGSNDTVRFNVIYNFCNFLDDGAAIYWSSAANSNYVNRDCEFNLVYGGKNASLGTNITIGQAVGIYSDDNNTFIRIRNNTCDSNSQAGIYVHDSQGIDVEDNTCYGNTYAQILLIHDNASFLKLRNDTVKSNNVGSPNSPLYYLISLGADYDSIGLIDSNIYITPTPQWYVGTSIGTIALQTYSQWQALIGMDAHSTFFPQLAVFAHNSSQINNLVVAPPPAYDYFLDLVGIQHVTYSIPPIQSIILFPKQTVIQKGNIRRKLHLIS